MQYAVLDHMNGGAQLFDLPYDDAVDAASYLLVAHADVWSFEPADVLNGSFDVTGYAGHGEPQVHHNAHVFDVAKGSSEHFLTIARIS